MISPNDSVIVTDGSEERRKFVDNVISQTDNKYLDTLIIYNKFLIQRNSVLKQARQTNVLDLGLIEILNFQLEEVGKIIFEKRRSFMAEFQPEFDRHYQFLTEDAESVQLQYESPLMLDSFLNILEKNLERDRILERTSQGIHKDDLIFTIHGGMPLKSLVRRANKNHFSLR
ncbi:hypothetical protein [Sphingobacterium sp. E70]|uniref:hypothetical protein n=1 Tax=Sphingobacterium sp. E70 TaxID=2853439 RepID=UPI0027956459|nr:hypothetical protein [Sphingobacterium sp. E70]